MNERCGAPRLEEDELPAIYCRARISPGCLHGKEESLEGLGYRMVDDGTFTKMIGGAGSVICTPCYIRIGAPDSADIGTALLAVHGVRIHAELVPTTELQPGDLFSTAGPDYWSSIRSDNIGERVFVRTAVVTDEEGMIYRLTLVKDERSVH